MSRRGNPYVFVVAGGILAALPFLGFPPLWETIYEIILGVFLVVVGALNWWAARQDGRHGDTFVESPRKPVAPSSHDAADVVTSPARSHSPIPSPFNTPTPSRPTSAATISHATPQSRTAERPQMQDVTRPTKLDEMPNIKIPAEIETPHKEVKKEVRELKDTKDEPSAKGAAEQRETKGAKEHKTSSRASTKTASGATARRSVRRKTTTRRRSTSKQQDAAVAGSFSAGNWE